MLLRVAKYVSAEIPVPGLSAALEVACSIAQKAKVCLPDSCYGTSMRTGLTVSHLGYQRVPRCLQIACRTGSVLLAGGLQPTEGLRYRLTVDWDTRTCRPTPLVRLCYSRVLPGLKCHSPPTSTLCDIESVMKRRHEKRALGVSLRHTDIAEEVRRLATQLDDAIRMFMVNVVFVCAVITLIMSCFQMRTNIGIMHGMDTLMSANGRLLQHVQDSARVGDVLISETRSIRIGVLDLAQRLSNNATYDGRVG